MLNRLRSLAALLVVVLNISGCGSIGGTASVHEGVWATYDCPNLANLIVGLQAREKELQLLMARSERGAGGAFVNLVAYRTEYDQAVGRLREARAEAGQKNCAQQSLSASGRAIQ